MRVASALSSIAFVVGTLAACEHELEQTEPLEDRGDAAAAGAWDGTATDEQALTRSCRPTQTLKGIDVSYYQGRIDWNAARRDGVAFAFIRVSDGVTFVDPRFEENWRNARAAGVRRGAYQFFRSNKDPVAQADLLLQAMGPLQDGDLPPVIDVESTDGQPRSVIVAKVARWVDRVEQALGVRPIIYTGPYFWRDNVAGESFGDNPLWIAHYGTECPLVPEPWTRFAFHQFTDSGRVTGVSGNVDVNVFAGTMADLDGLGFRAGQPPAVAPPDADGCPALSAAGGVVDEDSACVTLGGPAQYWRAVDGDGHEGTLAWTHATSSGERTNFATWNIRFERPGAYALAVWTDSSVATSQRARYRVEHDGVVESAFVDQRSTEGWRSLGTFNFAAGHGRVILNDNTGEALSLRRVLVVDALKATPSSAPPAPSCARVRVVNADELNVRPSASTSRAPIGTLRTGEVVERARSVDGESIYGNRTWHEIKLGSRRGFVSAYYTTCVN